MFRNILLGVLALLVLTAIAVFGFLPGYLEAQTNVVEAHDPYVISPEAQALHETLVVGDLHSDTLLWHRDVLARGNRGHVDLPRLQEGNVAFQLFTAVTKSPEGQNYDENTGDTDRLTQLVMVQRWPVRTWGSLYERAAYQAQRLRRAVNRSDGHLQLVLTRRDLAETIAARVSGERVTAALLGTEGSHALEGDLGNIQGLHDEGYRTMGLHHFFDNELGGSLHGITGEGLNDFGRAAVQEMMRLGVIIDVAHSSEATVDDVLAMTGRPVFVSHTGVYGECASARNISDDHMQRIAAAGGLIGIGYWEGAVCDNSPAGIVRSIRYAIDLVGVEHVALGSDYDGATTVTLDTSELAVLTQTMLDQGFTEHEIRSVMGGNAVQFFLENLPE